MIVISIQPPTIFHLISNKKRRKFLARFLTRACVIQGEGKEEIFLNVFSAYWLSVSGKAKRVSDSNENHFAPVCQPEKSYQLMRAKYCSE